jgi:hypothetical protein
VTETCKALRQSEDMKQAVFQKLSLEFGLETYWEEDFLFSIVRSKRGNAGSCIVLSSVLEEGAKTKVSSVGFLVEFANYLNSQNYVGKDVIVVFYNRRDQIEGVERFLQLYYYGGEKRTFRRSGAIQQALHLDFGFNKGVKKLVLKLNGNLRLPNLDLINMIVRTGTSLGVTRAQMITTNKFMFKFLSKFSSRVAFFLQFFLSQCFQPDEMHSVYNNYAADSVTVTHLGDDSPLVDGEKYFNLIEGATRSLLTLQETLHQSFYFYLLPSVFTYVPIGDYMILFGLFFLIFPVVLVYMALFSPAFATSNGNDYKLLAGYVGLVAGVTGLVWMWSYFIGLYFVLLIFMPDLKLNQSLTFLISLTFFSLYIVLCVLINFPYAVLSCCFGLVHMLAYLVNSKLVFVGLDPFILTMVLTQRVEFYPSLIAVALPMRLLQSQSIKKLIF